MNYKKVKIILIDPTGQTGWQTQEDLENFNPEECVIEGYLFSKDKKLVKTFSSYSINSDTGDMTFGDTNVLPTSCIKSIKAIK